MISVVIPALDDERALVPTLAALVSAAADGMVRDVVVVDGGSTDRTRDVADFAGCVVLDGPVDRALRLAEGARRAKGPWLMFLAPGVTLEPAWHMEARHTIETIERRGAVHRTAMVFRHAVDETGPGARAQELLSGLGRFVTGVPTPEQGLLIHHGFYERLGGFRPLPAMEDADLARRIGRSRIVTLRARALARPVRPRPSARRAVGFGLLALRVPPRLLARLYL